MLKKPEIQQVVDLSIEAGKKILKVYARDFAVYEKTDQSPLTEADLASHHCIVEGLAKLTPDIPVLSEESAEPDKDGRLSWQRYWLVDPLDGTKEFIKKNGEFTVNIALVENHQAILGVVHAPAMGVTYWGSKSQGAFKCQAGIESAIKVRQRPANTADWQVVGSRSHQSDDFKAFMAGYPGASIIPMGSSLKLCLVAEGKADLYPRLGPTSEWDTAAAQAIVEAAGGQVVALPEATPLRYNKHSNTLLNPHFLVCGQPLTNVYIQHLDIDKTRRAQIKKQAPCVLWFTGLSGSGKSTTANALEQRLHQMGYHTYILDGDNVRHGLNKDLGFTDVDRVENIRRITEVAKLMVDAGLIVLTAFISPFREERRMARSLFEEDEFIEVFVDASLEVAEARDPKGLYKRARAGQLKNFTGIDSVYEPPEKPELHLDAGSLAVEQLVKQVIGFLVQREIVAPEKMNSNLI